MSRLSSWFGGAKADDHAEADAAAAVAHLEQAMRATNLILNDDLDGAEAALRQGDSTFHDLGTALVFFMRAVLGFEKDNIATTMELCGKCEARAWEDLKKAQRRAAAGHAQGEIYPPGTEYEVVVVQTQLMSAVLGVMNESVLDAMKSFMKMRRAYIMLQTIMDKENAYFKKRPATRSGSRASKAEPDAFSGLQTPASSKTSLDGLEAAETLPSLKSTASVLPEMDVELSNPIDAFIHSGVSLCMGTLMLVMSMMPPAFARILSIVGFRGDRDAGIRLLWRSIAYPNTNGAFAGIMLLNYYQGLLCLVDIQPHPADFDESAEPYGLPEAKIEALLSTMRERFPQSRMWLIGEAKAFAMQRNLSVAIEKLSTGAQSKMKQMTAINQFSLALFCMSAHDWAGMRKAFLSCEEVSTWSPVIYAYMAGIASVELYRDAVARGDAGEAQVEKKKAAQYLRKAVDTPTKRKFMARQLPLDTFALRKVQKLEARAKDLGIDLVDAVSVSPAAEMIYVWSGYQFMSPTENEKMEQTLAWSRLTAPTDKLKKMQEPEELAIRAVCMSTVYRSENRFDEARKILDENVLSHDKNDFTGGHKEDYVMPAALHEIAAIDWAECGQPSADLDAKETEAYQKKKLAECEENLEKARTWEAYVLDTRLGMRIHCADATLAWYRKKKGWTA